MRETERWLDANAYLHKHQWWTCGSLHCEFLFQQMFQHAMATGWSKYKHAICCGQREPSPEQDQLAEPTTMELVGPGSMCQDINKLYQDLYQLHRLPRRGRFEEVTEERICKEILDSIKEHLRLKQPLIQQEREQAQLPVDTSQPDPHMAFATVNCQTYEEIMDLAWDIHQWALVAVAIL